MCFWKCHWWRVWWGLVRKGNWHGCISVGFAFEYVPSASIVICLDAEEVYFISFTRVTVPECGIEWRFDVRGRTNCDCGLPSSTVKIENHSDGQSVVEEQQRGGTHVGDRSWDAGNVSLSSSSVNSCPFFL